MERDSKKLCRLGSQARRPVTDGKNTIEGVFSKPRAKPLCLRCFVELYRDRIVAPRIVEALAAVRSKHEVYAKLTSGLAKNTDLVPGSGRKEQQPLTSHHSWSIKEPWTPMNRMITSKRAARTSMLESRVCGRTRMV